jgi:hypothetical protein
MSATEFMVTVVMLLVGRVVGRVADRVAADRRSRLPYRSSSSAASSDRYSALI